MKRLDPNNPTPGDSLYADFDGGISGIQNKFFRLTAWDSKLKLHWLRYCFLPIMAVPSIVHVMEWYAQFRHTTYDQLIDRLPLFLYLLLSGLLSSFVWLYQTGLLGAILVPLFAWGFLVTLGKLSKGERNLRLKVSRSRIIGVMLNLAFLYMGVKYLFPSMHGMFKIMIISLALVELFRIPLLRRYQQQYGSLDVEGFQKKRERKLRKEEKSKRVQNGRTKKKHGRQ
ncbi:hypothetical protein [Paenibacillus taichungensis]|uniref:hypothetical protein n=1 Tax=Paenibacillus taichungensis TaxID=484184 RepID=UPI0035D5DB0B